jgi:predicted small integral membrane protein
MMIRLLKCTLALFVALFCIMYALQNVVNLQAAHGFVALVVGMDGHLAYPNHFGPAITSPALIWLMLWIIIIGEFTAGLLAAKGALDMWKARGADAATFNTSKKFGILGAGVAVLVWFGLFAAVGGPYFQMWQTEAGLNAVRDASHFVMLHGVIAIYLSMRDG